MDIRYIKCKIDYKDALLQTTFCNFCPLMQFHKESLTIRCSRYKNPKTNNNFIRTINGYSVNGDNSHPITNIDIPDWCGLNTDIKKAQKEKWCYYKYDFNKYYLTSSDRVVPVISHRSIDIDVRSMRLYIKKEYKERIEKYFNAVDSAYDTDNRSSNKTYTKYNKIETCSCCGKGKDEVKRDKQLGMCDECWNKCEKNNINKYFSYINNFRLKRNKSWINKKFHVLDIDI